MRRVNSKDQKVRVSITLNGRKLSADRVAHLLSDFLRHLARRDRHRVWAASTASRGCCTVQIDGAAVRSPA